MAAPISILITGPESSGKSTVCLQLSKAIEADLVTEYARQYLSKIENSYTKEDFNKIVQGQKHAETSALKSSSKYIVLDTGPIVLSVWSKVRFNEDSIFLNSWMNESNYDYIFLCKPDFPWVSDPLREHQHHQKELFKLYVKKLQEKNLKFDVLEGNEKERLEFILKKLSL